MSTNYWLNQYEKESLAEEIKSYILTLYKTIDPSLIEQIGVEVTEYLRMKGNQKHNKIYVQVKKQSSGYALVIEIP